MKRSVLAVLGTLGAALAIPVVVSGALANGSAPDAAPAAAADTPVLVSAPSAPSSAPGNPPSMVHGNPHVVMFAVQWKLHDGSIPAHLDTALPAGWRTTFGLEALGRPGSGGETSATCHYEPDAEVLMCLYENAGGHEVEHGMNVPRSPKATYSVAVTGVPAGWTVDPDTVGEFSMRTECPKAAVAVTNSSSLAASKNDKAARGCLHTVVITKNAATAATTTTAASSPPLPTAGSSAMTAALVALSLLGTGLLTRRLARRPVPLRAGAGSDGAGDVG